MRRTIEVILTASTAQFSSGLASASAQVKGFAATTTSAVTSTDAAVKTATRQVGLFTAAVGVGLAAGLAVAVKSAADLEREMLNVATISADTRKNFDEVTASVVDMSREMPQSASVLAKGLYDIASSGFDGAEAMSVLRSSALAASAGLTTTDVAAKGVTAVLNAYGTSGFEAAKVSDILFQTVNKGVITFEELAGSLGDFVGMAAAFGKDAEGNFIVPIEDAAAALATMTLAGISAGEASTSLNRVLQSLIKPSEELAGKFKEWGYETGIAAVEALGLEGVMERLRKETGGNAAELVKLFNEIRAARGAFALMSDEGRNYADVARSITNETERLNATQEAYNKQAEGAAFQTELAMNQLKAFGIEVGQTALPVLREMAEFIGGFGRGLGLLPGPLTAAAAGLIAIAAAASLAAGGFLLLAPRVQATALAFPALASSVRGALPAIGMVSASLGILSVALSVVGSAYAKGRAEADRLTEAFIAQAQGRKDAAAVAQAQILAENGLINKAKELGLNLDLVRAAAQGNKGAMQELRETNTGNAISLAAFVNALGDQASRFKESEEAAKAQIAEIEKTNPALAKLAQSLRDVGLENISEEDIEKWSEFAAVVQLSEVALVKMTEAT